MNAISQDDEASWPPKKVAFQVRSIDLRVLEGEHPYHLREQEAARRNWQQELQTTPALYDGEMVLQHRLSLRDGHVRGEAYLVPFSTFLWWRKSRLPNTAFHLFAFALVVSSDGAIVAIRMGKHTANAGRVYCAAGSLDAHDIVDGRCDIAGNMRREVLEETGLDLEEATAEPNYFGLHMRRAITLMRVFRFDLSADELIERIHAHMLVDEEKEIDGAVAIWSADPDAHPYIPEMQLVIDWYFNRRA
ncbi:NUDIX hydrolase [Rhizobium sp. BK251]|uniref:NUDIX hydrolase n=1 Tax=Rhizobium sp. BK251 TaxID=2512125 RepID=UPI0010499E9E|nr:NUDIX hydrolase [Rhizobium sp. BK251]TCL73812.1 hypothetical protein EV286_103345 [Rhizobium sp. BK251]